MNNILLIARRDFASFFFGYAMWIIFAALLGLQGLLFAATALGPGSALYSNQIVSEYFYQCFGFSVAAAILLSMRTIAEERRDGTDVLLTTSTASDAQVVIAKWLATVGVVGIYALLSSYLPALVLVHGKVSLAHLAIGYTGILGAVSAATAIGVFSSSLFRFQLAAGLLTAVTVVGLVVVWILADISEAPFAETMAYAAFYNQHYEPFREGRLNISGLVYYFSLTGVFLMLATRMLEGRRWD